MGLTIVDFKGRYKARSISEFEDVLQRRYGPDANGFWISHDNESIPVISLLVKGDLSCIHYFPYDGHPGFASVGRANGLDRDDCTTFRFETVPRFCCQPFTFTDTY